MSQTVYIMYSSLITLHNSGLIPEGRWSFVVTVSTRYVKPTVPILITLRPVPERANVFSIRMPRTIRYTATVSFCSTRALYSNAPRFLYTLKPFPRAQNVSLLRGLSPKPLVTIFLMYRIYRFET